MTPEEIDVVVDHALKRGADDQPPVGIEREAEELREVAEWLDLADPAELVAGEPPDDLLARIHDATGPAPAATKRRLAPSWLGRWAPAVAAAVLVVAVAVSALWPSGSADEFIEFELAAVNGEPISAEFRFEVDGDQTTFFMRSDGLEATRYDVWVRTEGDGERHWIGRLDGDPDGTVSFVADFSPEEIERFWVTDPEDEPVLGHDID